MTGPRSALAVDGLDGSGKSQFAARLAAGLRAGGRQVVALHVDDFRRTTDFSGLEPAQESSLYYDHYFDFLDARAALASALAGPADGAIVLLEGVMVLRAELPAGTPLIVLEVSADEARRRILARDQAKGRTSEEISGRIDRRYFPAQVRYRAAFDPLGRADLVIGNEDWAHPRLVWRREAVFAPDIAAVLDRLLAAG